MTKKKKSSTSVKNVKSEVYGIIIIGLSLLIGISIYVKPSGIAGNMFRDFFYGIFGIGAYVFPILFLLIGFALIVNKGKIKIKMKFWAICVFAYDILLVLQVNYTYINRELDFMKRLNKAYLLGLESIGGGIFSEIINIPLLYILGRTGTYIILICIAIILLIVSTEISLGEIFDKIIQKYKGRKLKEKNRDKDKVITKINQKNNIEEVQDKINFENNIEKIDKKIKILDFLKRDEDKEEDDEENEEEAIEQVKSKNSEHKKDYVNTNSPNEIVEEINKNQSEVKKIEYKYPSINLLAENKFKSNVQDKKDLLNNAKILEETLQSFGVEAKVVQVSRGPSVTRYELHPNPGVKVSKIVNLADDIALNLAAPSVRIEAPIPGKAAVGIEVPNREVVPVMLREVLESNEFIDFNSRVAFALGKDVGGKCIVTDISKMPHLLIAGATGSGKSVCINSLIASLVYKSSPDAVKMLLIDPKVVELSVYNGIPHLLIPVVTDPKKAASALYWAVNEMTQRYKLFADNNVRNIESYNKLIDTKSIGEKLPQIIIIIDELADLMMVAANDVEDAICRLAQMARAAGMHLVIATQRPSVDVITGVIKANIPSRISFAVSSQIDSRTILDMAGAEKLLGKGDMLFLPIGENKPIRIQGAFISEKEVEAVVEYLKASTLANYSDEIIEVIEKKTTQSPNYEDSEDELLPEAIKIGFDYGQISASMLQRRLRIGFNRASRIVEDMESKGIVGPQDGSRPRQFLMSKEEFEDDLD